jgi:hypothetical protein
MGLPVGGAGDCAQLSCLAGRALVCHHYFRSPLARRVFHEALPRPLDSTRGWGIPNPLAPPIGHGGAMVAPTVAFGISSVSG